MIRISPETCCGCSACEAVCRSSAIVMEPDALGFLYPKTDIEKCVDCGLCDKVCPFNPIEQDGQENDILSIEIYAAQNKDMQIVEASRSGGIFTAISNSVLESGGTVYGAIISDGMIVKHGRAATEEGRNRMRGSKYIQSDMRNIYSAIRSDLNNGKKVLFSGTPCQTASLSRFLPTRLQGNLYLVDIVCHGVGSPAIWSDYIRYLELKESSKIVEVDFRDKAKFGWDGIHKESFSFIDSEKRRYFPFVYYNDNHIRRSCNNCPYANLARPSDITLGDLWGFDDIVPDWQNRKKGCSLVLINSRKGKELFMTCRDFIEMRRIDKEAAMQPHLKYPLPKSAQRDEYERIYIKDGFEGVLYKFHKEYKPGLLKILSNRVKMLLK